MMAAMLRGVVLSVMMAMMAMIAHAQAPECGKPAAPVDTIRVGAYIYPPASYLDESGNLTGKTVEALRAVLTAMGYKPKFNVMPFKRCLEFMKDGAFPIMLPCVINADRLEYMQYSEPVYYIDSVLWKMGDDTSGCWRSFRDLKGLLVGATNGYAYGPEWEDGVLGGYFRVDMVASKNPEVIHFQKIIEGRTDMFICERSLGEFIKQRHAPRFDDVYPCPKSMGPVRSFNAPISRKYFEQMGRDPEAFLARFNEELARYRTAAETKQSFSSHFPVHE